MQVTCFDKSEQARINFTASVCHNSQLKALKNFSMATYFADRDYLELLNCCFQRSYLSDEEATFLGHLLDKHQINHLDWSHRTPWLKATINDLRRRQISVRPSPISPFDRPVKENYGNIPVHLIQTPPSRVQYA